MKKTLLLGLLLIPLIFLWPAGVQGDLEPSPYIIDGSTVYINDTQAYIMIEPHTINRREPVTATFMTKQYTGDLTLAFGFDNTEMQPSNLRRVIFTTTERTYSRTCDTNNKSAEFNYSGGTAQCWTKNYADLVWTHHYDWIDTELETLYWLENVTTETVTPIAATPKTYNGTINGKNTWYYYDNVAFTANEPKTYRITLQALKGEGKYDVAAFPSSYGNNFNDAILNNDFYLIDPWWDSSAQEVMHFGFGEGSGTWINDTFKNVNFSMNAMAWNDTEYPTFNETGDGAPYSGEFDGSTAYGLSTTAIITADANYSICGWLYTTDTTQSGYFLSQMDNVDWNKEDFIIELETSGLSVRKRTNDTQSDADRIRADIRQNAWVQWCFVYDASVGDDGEADPDYLQGALNLYVNGTLANDTVVDQNVNGWSAVETRIGRAVASVEYDGKLDDITVWDDALNSSDVANLYNLGPPRGYLTVAAVTPSVSGDVTQNEYFEYTAEITCNGAYCGDVTGYLDPKPSVSGPSRSHASSRDPQEVPT